MTEGLVGGEGFAIDASVVKADANRQRGRARRRSRLVRTGHAISRPVREYLAALDQPRWRGAPEEHLADRSGGAVDCGWGPAFYAYSANYLIDIAAGIMVDVEATPAHKTDEINATKTMIERVEERFDLKPERLIGDTNYGTAAMLGWMVDEKQIEPHMSGVGQDPTRRRNAIQQRLPVGRTGQRIPLPTGPAAAE